MPSINLSLGENKMDLFMLRSTNLQVTSIQWVQEMKRITIFSTNTALYSLTLRLQEQDSMIIFRTRICTQGRIRKKEYSQWIWPWIIHSHKHLRTLDIWATMCHQIRKSIRLPTCWRRRTKTISLRSWKFKAVNILVFVYFCRCQD